MSIFPVVTRGALTPLSTCSILPPETRNFEIWSSSESLLVFDFTKLVSLFVLFMNH